jgi:hypothetical protein
MVSYDVAPQVHASTARHLIDTRFKPALHEEHGIPISVWPYRESLTFAAKTSAVALDVTRPLGIVFEEVDGIIVAVEILDGSSAVGPGINCSQHQGWWRSTQAARVGGKCAKSHLEQFLPGPWNVEQAGVKTGDILRVMSAVAVGLGRLCSKHHAGGSFS